MAKKRYAPEQIVSVLRFDPVSWQQWRSSFGYAARTFLVSVLVSVRLCFSTIRRKLVQLSIALEPA